VGRPDSRAVADSFHRRAADYDSHVLVQKRVAATLLSSLEAAPAAAAATRILDAGSGTGALLPGIHARFPASRLTAVDIAYNMCLHGRQKNGEYCGTVTGDIQQLPFKREVFDLVVSASALQWVGDLKTAIHEMRRVLKPGGSLAVAFFCDGTLHQLQKCFRDAARLRGYPDSRLHSFWKRDELAGILEQLDFERYVITVETETDWYDDLTSLLRSIKNIGAGATARGGGGLGWRGVLNDVSSLYKERYGENGKIPASYQVLYLHASLPGVVTK